MRFSSRRFFTLLCSLCLLCLLDGCRDQPKEADTIRVGIALYQRDDTFLRTLTQQLESFAQDDLATTDVKVSFILSDAQSSQTTQNNQIDRFLTLDYDVICVNIVDRASAATLIDKASRYDIPLIFFNREPVAEDLDRWDQVYYVGSHADEAGILQGEIILDEWRTPGSQLDRNQNGILDYVLLEGEPNHQDALLRTKYSLRTLENAGVSINRLANATADWTRGLAYAKMSQWISELGPDIELVLCNNDDMAIGAIDAYQAVNTPLEDYPFIIGVDGSTSAMAALEAGTLKGTVLNDSTTQARTILDLIYQLTDVEYPTDGLTLEDDKYIWVDYAPLYPPKN